LEVDEHMPHTDEALKEDPVEEEVTVDFIWSVDLSEMVCLDFRLDLSSSLEESNKWLP
jgi:hypothetical protein